MTQYKVDLNIRGTLRVEADSAEEAEDMAEEAPVLIAGCKLMNEQVEATSTGEVEHHTLQPDDVTSTVDVGGL